LSHKDVDEIRAAFFKFFTKLLRFYEQEPDDQIARVSDSSGKQQLSDYSTNTYKNDVFLKAYEKDRQGQGELGFLRVFTTTSLFQRLTFRDKFHEDEAEIQLFKRYAQAEKKNESLYFDKFWSEMKIP